MARKEKYIFNYMQQLVAIQSVLPKNNSIWVYISTTNIYSMSNVVENNSIWLQLIFASAGMGSSRLGLDHICFNNRNKNYKLIFCVIDQLCTTTTPVNKVNPKQQWPEVIWNIFLPESAICWESQVDLPGSWVYHARTVQRKITSFNPGLDRPNLCKSSLIIKAAAAALQL